MDFEDREVRPWLKWGVIFLIGFFLIGFLTTTDIWWGFQRADEDAAVDFIPNPEGDNVLVVRRPSADKAGRQSANWLKKVGSAIYGTILFVYGTGEATVEELDNDVNKLPNDGLGDVPSYIDQNNGGEVIQPTPTYDPKGVIVARQRPPDPNAKPLGFRVGEALAAGAGQAIAPEQNVVSPPVVVQALPPTPVPQVLVPQPVPVQQYHPPVVNTVPHVSQVRPDPNIPCKPAYAGAGPMPIEEQIRRGGCMPGTQVGGSIYGGQTVIGH